MAFQRDPADTGVLADISAIPHLTGKLKNEKFAGPALQVGSNNKGRNAHFVLYEGIKRVLNKHPDGSKWLRHFTEEAGDRFDRSHAGKLN